MCDSIIIIIIYLFMDILRSKLDYTIIVTNCDPLLCGIQFFTQYMYNIKLYYIIPGKASIISGDVLTSKFEKKVYTQ